MRVFFDSSAFVKRSRLTFLFQETSDNVMLPLVPVYGWKWRKVFFECIAQRVHGCSP